MAHTYNEYKDGYKRLLETVQIRPSWTQGLDVQARRILSHKDKYLEVENATGVPWRFVGVVHSLECGLSFNGHLHNGDPLTRRTRLVPAGHPKAGSPPFTWLESAIDALKIKKFDKITDWHRLERVAFSLEAMNGFGYRKTGINSPYLWSGSNHYNRGKYIRDHVYDPQHVSQQTGAMLLYLRLLDIEDPVSGALGKQAPKQIVHTGLLHHIRDGFRWIVGAITGLFTLETWGFSKDFLTTLKEFAFSTKGVLIIGGICLALWLYSEWLEKKKQEAAKAALPPTIQEEVDNDTTTT